MPYDLAAVREKWFTKHPWLRAAKYKPIPLTFAQPNLRLYTATNRARLTDWYIAESDEMVRTFAYMNGSSRHPHKLAVVDRTESWEESIIKWVRDTLLPVTDPADPEAVTNKPGVRSRQLASRDRPITEAEVAERLSAGRRSLARLLRGDYVGRTRWQTDFTGSYWMWRERRSREDGRECVLIFAADLRFIARSRT